MRDGRGQLWVAAALMAMPTRGLAAGRHYVVAKLSTQPLRSRGRQHLVGKRFTQKLVGHFRTCG